MGFVIFFKCDTQKQPPLEGNFFYSPARLLILLCLAARGQEGCGRLHDFFSSIMIHENDHPAKENISYTYATFFMMD